MSADAKDIQLMELKDTILQLNETIRIQNAAMDDLRKMIAGLQQTLNNKQAEIDYLKSKMFGSSSEKGKVLIPGQMNLLTEDLEDDRTPVEIEPEIIKVAEHKRERKAKATYEVMFANLPVRQVKVDTLSEEEKECPLCGTQMTAIGTEIVRTELIYHPAKLERVEYIGTTYECPACKDSLGRSL